MPKTAAPASNKNNSYSLFHDVIVGDCIDELFRLRAGIADVVITDPPYNIGIDYGSGGSEDRRDDYDSWCAQWILGCHRVLKKSGSIWIVSGQEHGSDIDIALRAAGFTIRNRITWHETFGVYCSKKFGRCSRPIFYAVKNEKEFVFNREAVTIPSARQEKYKDKRAAAGGKIMGDVWKINRVCGTFKERIPGVPTQLPRELVSRMMLVSSNEGDVVIDPFLGSGTTLVVAKSLNRSGVGIERSHPYAKIAKGRIETE